MATGAVPVSVITLGGISAVASPLPPTDEFTYEPAPAPGRLSSNSGPYEGGNQVTIGGSNLGDAALGGVVVDFGTNNPATIVSDGVSGIVVTVPLSFGLALGAVNVTVTTPDGTASAGQYTYEVVPPTITNLSASAGPATIQTQVIITGQDLLDAKVYFGGVQAAIVRYSDLFDQITVLTPLATKAGAADVTVTTPLPNSQSVVTSNSLPFSYGSGVSVTGVDPPSGLAGGDIRYSLAEPISWASSLRT